MEEKWTGANLKEQGCRVVATTQGKTDETHIEGVGKSIGSEAKGRRDDL